MRKWIAGLAMLAMFACAFVPSVCFTEDRDTVRLARTIYALGKEESYETKLALGTVVMNRVDSPWYPDTVMGVLNQPQQFACGTLYDDESLRAARAVMMGARTLPADVVCYGTLDATQPLREDTLFTTSGVYGFYTAQ